MARSVPRAVAIHVTAAVDGKPPSWPEASHGFRGSHRAMLSNGGFLSQRAVVGAPARWEDHAQGCSRPRCQITRRAPRRGPPLKLRETWRSRAQKERPHRLRRATRGRLRAQVSRRGSRTLALLGSRLPRGRGMRMLFSPAYGGRRGVLPSSACRTRRLGWIRVARLHLHRDNHDHRDTTRARATACTSSS